MRIFRVLNNNVVIVQDGGQEKVVMGKGLGFQKRSNDLLDTAKIEKVFALESQESGAFERLAKLIPEEHLQVAEEIISQAERILGGVLNGHIHVALADHLSFAIERQRNGMAIENRLLPEIRLLYPQEYALGCWALERIESRLCVTMPEDEAGYLALHLHTAKMQRRDMGATMNVTSMIKEIVELIEAYFQLRLAAGSISYQRLLTHLRFALQRMVNGEGFYKMEEGLLAMIRDTYPQEMACASQIAAHVLQEYDYELPPSEAAYISLHIRRIRQLEEESCETARETK